MLDLYRARRTTGTAAESADNWHFLQMRVFIILSLSMGGPTADHTHTIFWERSWVFLLCVSSVPCSIHFPSWEEKKKVCFLRVKGRISIAKQSIEQNNMGWMWAFEKVICTKWPLILALFFWMTWDVSFNHTKVHTEQCTQYPSSVEDPGCWKHPQLTAIMLHITLTEQCHFIHKH